MKVIELISTLDKRATKEFSKFIKSPYFNDNEKLIILYEELKRLNGSEVDKTKIFRSLSKKAYDANAFRKLCNALTDLVLKFHKFEQFQQEELTNPNYTLKSIKKYSIKSHINIALRNAESTFSNQKRRDSDFFIKHYNYLLAKFDLNSEYDKQVQLEKSPNDFFGSIADAIYDIDTFYLIERIKITITYLQFYKLLKRDDFPKYHKDLTNHLIKTIKHPDEPLIQLYINTYELLTIETYKIDLQKIDNLFLKSIDQTTKKELSDLYVHFTNHSIRKLLTGQKEYYSILFNLYKIGMNYEILPINNPTEYRNIAATACQLKEFNWALNFIESYKDALPEDQQDSAYSFTKARIYGNMKNWTQLLETLRNVEYEDIGYNLNSKLFIIMSYFELDEYEALDSFIKSFKVFLRRRRNIPVTRKNAFYDFTSVVDHLMKAGDRGDAKRLIKAREVLDSNAAIPNKDWLLEKIEEIEAVIKK